jgi:hypothetical protein
MRRHDIFAGSILAASACLVVFAMLHHPSGHMHGQGTVNGYVHGGMIGFLIAWWFGLAWLVTRWSLPHPLPVAGLAAFSASTVVHIISATINGFVVPSLAGHGQQAPGHDVFLLCWVLNQAFARIGVFATGAAFALFGVYLVSVRGLFQRIAGLAALVSAAVPIVILLRAGWRMDVQTAFVIYAFHAGWIALVGAGLAAGRLTEAIKVATSRGESQTEPRLKG